MDSLRRERKLFLDLSRIISREKGYDREGAGRIFPIFFGNVGFNIGVDWSRP